MENYFLVYSDNLKKFIPTEPVYVLKQEDINEEDGSVMVNGEEVFVITENTNYYADDTTPNFCQEGDLVFETNGEYAFYREGIGAPSAFVNTLQDALVGTESELKLYIDNFFKNESKKKQSVKLTENELTQMVTECVRRILKNRI